MENITYIADLSGCKNTKHYDNKTNLDNLLLECANLLKAKLINLNIYQFRSSNISGFVYFQEGFIHIHFSPDELYCSITISSTVHNVKEVIKHFAQELEASHMDIVCNQRGIKTKDETEFRIHCTKTHGAINFKDR